MIEISIPGDQTYTLHHLILDYNGTLAEDGVLIEGVPERLLNLSERLQVHVITADTFGAAQRELQGVPCEMVILPGDHQAQAKQAYLQNLGSAHCAAIGNGRNDRLMLESAALSVAVIQAEGAALQTCLAADVVVTDILAALDLFLFPKGLIATLRM